MLTKKITYEGLDGPITEEYLFHITQAQILELNLPYANADAAAGPDEPTGLEKRFQTITQSNDNMEIYAEFKKIILMAVGKKSPDGKRFIKSDEIRQDFENTEAYSELIIEMMEDVDQAAKFFAGIMPAKVQEQTRKDEIDKANAAASIAATPAVATPEPRILTRAEMIEMDGEKLRQGLANGEFVPE